MAVTDLNKGSFFYLEISLPNFYGLDSQKHEKDVETNMDISLSSIGAKSNVYKFQSENKFIYLFSTYQRKRRGQLNKLIEKNLLKNSLIEDYHTTLFLKSEYLYRIKELKLEKEMLLLNEPDLFEGYTGKDLRIFNNKENWFPWQLSIYDMLFHKSGEIKEADPRKIIALYCKDGKSGKSSFFKHLFFEHPEDIGRLTYGSGGQLRSAVVKMGPKRIYIVDLTRSKSKQDSEEDILSAIEDIKNGFISTHMFGSKDILIMDIPHIVVSSNFIFNQTLLSKDRWKILSITDKDKACADITEKVEELEKNTSKY